MKASNIDFCCHCHGDFEQCFPWYLLGGNFEHSDKRLPSLCAPLLASLHPLPSLCAPSLPLHPSPPSTPLSAPPPLLPSLHPSSPSAPPPLPLPSLCTLLPSLCTLSPPSALLPSLCTLLPSAPLPSLCTPPLSLHSPPTAPLSSLYLHFTKVFTICRSLTAD